MADGNHFNFREFNFWVGHDFQFHLSTSNTNQCHLPKRSKAKKCTAHSTKTQYIKEKSVVGTALPAKKSRHSNHMFL